MPARFGLQMFALAFEFDDFLLGKQFVAAIGRHFVQLFEPLHRLLHRNPIGEQSAEPALVHVETATTRCFFGDGVLGLALGAHEQHNLSLHCQVLHKLRCLFEHLQSFLQVNNVNPVALSEDVFLHPGIPTLGLMPEVNSRFEQLLHGDISQLTSSLSLHQELRSLPIAIPAPHASTGRILNSFQPSAKASFTACCIGSAFWRPFVRTSCALSNASRG